MRGWFLAAAPLLVALLAGCNSGGHAAVSRADFVTPGTWDIHGKTDYMYAWAHNAGSDSQAINWSLTLPGGAALPAGWQVTFRPPSATLGPNGAKGQTSPITYPDWAATRITLTVPESQAAAQQAVELHAGTIMASEMVSIAATRGNVSAPGSVVTVHYDGKFENGTRFDQGQFETQLGKTPAQTVPGFDNGLMGLAIGETATLHIPPAFAYGYDNRAPTAPGRPDMTKFNGQTLVFTVSLTKIA